MEDYYQIVAGSRKFVLTEKGKQELKQQYAKGYSQSKIANKFGVSREVIIRWMKEENIPTRKRIYSIQEDYFKNIETEEQAYWLGFLSADGYVHEERGEITLELQENDKEHIQKFAKAIQSNKPLMEIRCGENKEFLHYRFTIKCRKMVDDLKKYNVCQRKSLTFTPPELPEDFVPYWILGYMDGDGCIYGAKGRVKINFVGTLATLQFIKTFFSSFNQICLEHNCQNTYSFTLEVAKSETFLREMNYNNLYYALERKKKRYASIIQ